MATLNVKNLPDGLYRRLQARAKRERRSVGRSPVSVDTALFIYFIEKDPRFLPHILPLFAEADDGRR